MKSRPHFLILSFLLLLPACHEKNEFKDIQKSLINGNNYFYNNYSNVYSNENATAAVRMNEYYFDIPRKYFFSYFKAIDKRSWIDKHILKKPSPKWRNIIEANQISLGFKCDQNKKCIAYNMSCSSPIECIKPMRNKLFFPNNFVNVYLRKYLERIALLDKNKYSLPVLDNASPIYPRYSKRKTILDSDNLYWGYYFPNGDDLFEIIECGKYRKCSYLFKILITENSGKNIDNSTSQSGRKYIIASLQFESFLDIKYDSNLVNKRIVDIKNTLCTFLDCLSL